MPEHAARHAAVPALVTETRVPDEEIRFRASRARGPGGQHVNKSSTRVEATWNVERTESLTEDERRRLRKKLWRRIAADGTLRVAVDEERSQARNRTLAAQRLRALVERALHQPKPRKRTRPSRAAVERRLDEKRRHAARKRQRRRPVDD